MGGAGWGGYAVGYAGGWEVPGCVVGTMLTSRGRGSARGGVDGEEEGWGCGSGDFVAGADVLLLLYLCLSALA